MWNIVEQNAFVDSYKQGIASDYINEVENAVALYAAGNDIPLSENYTSIMDAIHIWNYAVLFQMRKEQKK